MSTQATLIKPFAGLRPSPQYAQQVAAPPYDVLNSQEAARLATGNPHSFLHVSKAEIDLEPQISPHDPRVYQKAADNFRHMQDSGVLLREDAPSLYLYRLVMEGRMQVGVVAAVSVDAYVADRVKKHEYTRPDKEDDRTRFAQALSANSGPVFLTYRQSKAVDALVAQAMAAAPLYDFVAEDGVSHTFWRLSAPGAIDALVSAFEAVETAYVADGHHRSAAAVRVCSACREANPGFSGEEGFNRFLAVLFPDNQMRILDYNRVVRDLNGATAAEFLHAVSQSFTITPQEAPYKPQGARHFGLFLEERWYALAIKPELVNEADPVGRLDVSLLSDHLLAPILGITDPRRDQRIDFVGGIRGLDGLMARVRSGEMVAAFSMYPPSLADMMAVADAGRVMPPKSTWFEPKLRDGLVIQTF